MALHTAIFSFFFFLLFAIKIGSKYLIYHTTSLVFKITYKNYSHEVKIFPALLHTKSSVCFEEKKNSLCFVLKTWLCLIEQKQKGAPLKCIKACLLKTQKIQIMDMRNNNHKFLPCLPTISATCSELGTGTHSVIFIDFFMRSSL